MKGCFRCQVKSADVTPVLSREVPGLVMPLCEECSFETAWIRAVEQNRQRMLRERYAGVWPFKFVEEVLAVVQDEEETEEVAA